MWRFDIINFFITEYNYKRYLEIGVEDGDNIKLIKAEHIEGVDPHSAKATHKMTSDAFFAKLDEEKSPLRWDIIFIDGLHVDEQVVKDLNNSLRYLSEGGTIVIHDCNPPSIWHQRSPEEASLNGYRLWNGTVWKAYVKFRNERADLKMAVVDTDWGCGIVRTGVQQTLMIDDGDITYENLDANRAEWLNLISCDEMKKQFQNHQKNKKKLEEKKNETE